MSDTMRISLNAFIRLFALDAPRQMAEISRRMQQGSSGYDFYKSLNFAIKAYIAGKSKDEIDFILNSPTNPSEVSYNRMAFQNFEKRFGKKRSKLKWFDHKQNLFLAKKTVCIVVSPSFSLETPDGIDVFQVWATQTPQVSNHMGGIGCYVCKEAFRKTSASNYHFKFFDAVGSRVYSTYYNTTPALVNKTAFDIAHWAQS